MTLPPVRRVVLVGFMASGKSSVGPRLAAALGWRFHDVDAAVEARAGMSVAGIFAERGEAWFRALEGEETARLLNLERVVIATGGGWAAKAGSLETLPEGSVSVWLRVSPEEAVRRAGAQAGTRPLLSVSDPVVAARELLDRRTAAYARCTLEVDTDGRTVEDVSARILEELGWNPAEPTAVEMG